MDKKLEKAKEILTKLEPKYKGVLVRFVDNEVDSVLPLTGKPEDEIYERAIATTSALMIARNIPVEFRRVWREEIDVKKKEEFQKILGE